MKDSILVVDDNGSDVELLLLVLQSLRADLQIYVARDGQEAIDFLLTTDGMQADPWLSLILLDIKMPRVDGLEVLKILKADSHTKLIPVVMFTSSNEGKDLETAYRRGANGYVVKPVDFQEYQNLLKAILGYWLDANQLPDSEARRPTLHGSPVFSGSKVHECALLLRNRKGGETRRQ